MIYFNLDKMLKKKKAKTYNLVVYDLDDDGSFGYMLNTSKGKYIDEETMIKVDLYRSVNNGAIVFTIINKHYPIFIGVMNTERNYVLMLEDMPASIVGEVFYKFYERSKQL